MASLVLRAGVVSRCAYAHHGAGAAASSASLGLRNMNKRHCLVHNADGASLLVGSIVTGNSIHV